MSGRIQAHKQKIAAFNRAVYEPELTPEDLENRKASKAMHKKLGVKDAAENLNSHLPEICEFGIKNKMTFGQSLDFMIKTTPGREPDPDIKRNLFIRNDVRFEADEYGPSDQLNRIAGDYALCFLMHEYQNDVLFNGIHTPDFWKVSPTNPLHNKPMAFAPAITRTQASDDTSNIQTVGRLEMAYPLMTDVQVADIIGERTVIRNNRYFAPILKEPEDYKLTKFGELADIRVWGMTTDDRPIVTTKAGFGVRHSYESMRTTDLYLSQITDFTNWLRYLTQTDLVNEGIGKIASGTYSSTGANANIITYSTSGRVMNAQEHILTKLQAHKGRRRKGFTMNLGVGGRWFVAKYFGQDLTTQSSNMLPGMPDSRSVYDPIRWSAPIIFRENDEVSDIAGQNQGYFWDRRYTLRYIMERNSTIEETERRMSNQSITTYNTFSYAWDLMEPANEGLCTWQINLP